MSWDIADKSKTINPRLSRARILAVPGYNIISNSSEKPEPGAAISLRPVRWLRSGVTKYKEHQLRKFSTHQSIFRPMKTRNGRSINNKFLLLFFNMPNFGSISTLHHKLMGRI